MSDRIAAGVVFLLAAYYGLAANRLESGFGSGTVAPKDFPLLLAGALAVFAICMFVRVDPEPRWPKLGQWVNVVTVVISFALYAYLLVPLGFIAATSLETALVSQRFGGKLWQALVVGVLASLSLYVLFVFGLDISLPRGNVWSNLWGR
ncbi:MAG: tripartite tricarboxylate transporter TctB family protein [Deinococcota bacterium]